jgi:short-subunit dehydrogenase
LAVELAAAGVNVVLTARRKERLEAIQIKLATEFGIQTRIVVADLERPDAPEKLFAATEGAGLEIDVLVNNAGFGYYGEFAKGEAARQAAMVQVNCTAVVALTNLFVPRMIARGRGDVLIVASTAAYQPVPYLATYAATKVFDRYLAEGLAAEVKRYGLRVSALCPGPTESEFVQVSGVPANSMRGSQKADIVARRGLEGLVRGKYWVIPYLGGRASTFAQRFLPRSLVTAAAEKMFRPK